MKKSNFIALIVAILAAIPCAATRSQTFDAAPIESVASAQGLRILAFTSANCPACKRVAADRLRLVREGYRVECVDALTVAGAAEARAWKVTQIPTFLILNGSVEVDRVGWSDMCASGCYVATVSAWERAKKKIGRAVATVAGAPLRVAGAALGLNAGARVAVVATDGAVGGYRLRYVERQPATGYIIRRYSGVDACDPVGGYATAGVGIICDDFGACRIVDDVGACDPVRACDPVESVDGSADGFQPVASPYDVDGCE